MSFRYIRTKIYKRHLHFCKLFVTIYIFCPVMFLVRSWTFFNKLLIISQTFVLYTYLNNSSNWSHIYHFYKLLIVEHRSSSRRVRGLALLLPRGFALQALLLLCRAGVEPVWRQGPAQQRGAGLAALGPVEAAPGRRGQHHLGRTGAGSGLAAGVVLLGHVGDSVRVCHRVMAALALDHCQGARTACRRRGHGRGRRGPG